MPHIVTSSCGASRLPGRPAARSASRSVPGRPGPKLRCVTSEPCRHHTVSPTSGGLASIPAPGVSSPPWGAAAGLSALLPPVCRLGGRGKALPVTLGLPGKSAPSGRLLGSPWCRHPSLPLTPPPQPPSSRSCPRAPWSRLEGVGKSAVWPHPSLPPFIILTFQSFFVCLFVFGILSISVVRVSAVFMKGSDPQPGNPQSSPLECGRKI